MSAESGLYIRIGYEEVEELKNEIREVSKQVEKLTTDFDKMDRTLDDVDVSTKKAAKSLGIISGIKKLELINLLGGMFDKMMDIGRASPLLASNLAIIDFQMQEVGMVVGDAVAPIFEKLSNILQKVIDWWYALDEPTKEAITTGIQVAAVIGIVAAAWMLLNTAMGPILIVLLAITAAVAAGILIWNEFGDEIMAIIDEAITYVTELFQGFLEFIDKLFDDPLGAIIEFYVNWYKMLADVSVDGWKIVNDIFSGALDFLIDMFKDVPILGPFVEGLKNAWTQIDKIIGGIIDVFSSLIKFLTGEISLSDFVSQIIDAFGDIVAGVLNITIIDPLNNMIGQVESALNLIRNIEIFGAKPFQIIPSVSLPRLPKLHEGGYVGGGPPGTEIPILAKSEELLLASTQQRTIDAALNVALANVGGGGTTNNNQQTVVNVYMKDNSVGSGQLGRRMGTSIVDELRGRGAYR